MRCFSAGTNIGKSGRRGFDFGLDVPHIISFQDELWLWRKIWIGGLLFTAVHLFS